MTTLRQAAAGLFALLCLVAAGPQEADAQATFVPLTKPMRLAAPVRPVKSGAAIYIVKLKEPGAASYKGGTAGYAATKPGVGQRLNALHVHVEERGGFLGAQGIHIFLYCTSFLPSINPKRPTLQIRIETCYPWLPWVQLVLKQEDFRRSEISEALRNRGTTGGVNVEFGGGMVRLLADYVSRKIGTPGTRKSQLITQAQVKF